MLSLPDGGAVLAGFAVPSGETALLRDAVAFAMQRQILGDIATRLPSDWAEGFALLASLTDASEYVAPCDPTFSIARRWIKDGRDPLPAAAEIALHMQATLGDLTLAATLPAPVRLRHGRRLFPAAREIVLRTAHGSAAVMLDRRQRDAIDLPGLQTRHGPIAIVHQHIGPTVLLDGVDADIAPLLGGSADMVCAALDRLGVVAPDYCDWVGGAVRVVLLTRSVDERMDSGSNPGWLGAIRVSTHSRWEAIAEMLVHEASHQYFYLLELLGLPLVADASAFAYSPLKSTARPLVKLLLGYHAFANVVLMFRTVQDSPAASRFGADCLARALRDVEVLRRGLASPGTLAPLGEMLFGRIERALGA
jgi:hypothetical protein